MSIGNAGRLVALAERQERAHCVRVLLKHIKRETCGTRCCDNCNCMALRNALTELGWKPRPRKDKANV